MSILIPSVLNRKFFIYLYWSSKLSTKLFVGSLPFSVDDNTLQKTFEGHGTVVSAKVIKDRETGRSRGFGFVEMENSNEAKNAMNALHDTKLEGRNIVVNEAKARD
jgi:RNA recognition motif-containing protein